MVGTDGVVLVVEVDAEALPGTRLVAVIAVLTGGAEVVDDGAVVQGACSRVIGDLTGNQLAGLAVEVRGEELHVAGLEALVHHLVDVARRSEDAHHVEEMGDVSVAHVGHGIDDTIGADRASVAPDHVVDNLDTGRLQRRDERLLNGLGLTGRIGGRDTHDAVGGEHARVEEPGDCELEALRVGVGETHQSALTAIHEVLRLALGRNEDRLLRLDDAHRCGALETRTVEDHDGVQILGGLEAGLVALGLHGRAEQGDLDRLQHDLTAANAATLLIEVVDIDAEHVVHIANWNTKADVDCVLQPGLEVDDRQRVGLDAVVGCLCICCGIVGDTEGVELGEGMIAAVEAGLELGEDATSRVVVGVGAVIGFGGAGILFRIGLRLVGFRFVVFGRCVVNRLGLVAVIARLVDLAAACCRKQRQDQQQPYPRSCLHRSHCELPQEIFLTPCQVVEVCAQGLVRHKSHSTTQ